MSDCVYLIESDDGTVKIGKSNIARVRTRLTEIQTGTAARVRLRRVIAGADEKAMHAHWAKHRVRGEWFKPDPELRDLVAGADCSKWGACVPVESLPSASSYQSKNKRGTWSIASRRYGYELRVAPILVWSVDGLASADDYTANEMTAREAWSLWVQKYARPIMPIWWYVTSDDARLKYELAPRQYHLPDKAWADDFSTHYRCDPSDNNGQKLDWSQLPVQDGAWESSLSTSGGWFQQLTGCKPRAMQPWLDVTFVARANDLWLPDGFHE